MAPILTIDCTVLRHKYSILQQLNPSAWNNLSLNGMLLVIAVPVMLNHPIVGLGKIHGLSVRYFSSIIYILLHSQKHPLVPSSNTAKECKQHSPPVDCLIPQPNTLL